MSAPRTITLPEPVADALAARVASGDYASESDVIREGLLALDAQDGAIEAWVVREGAARFDAYEADPGRARPADEAFKRIKQRIVDSSEL